MYFSTLIIPFFNTGKVNNELEAFARHKERSEKAFRHPVKRELYEREVLLKAIVNPEKEPHSLLNFNDLELFIYGIINQLKRYEFRLVT